MNKCIECGISTKNPKFCSRSCSGSYNNRMRDGCIGRYQTKTIVGKCGHDVTINLRASAKNAVCDTCKEILIDTEKKHEKIVRRVSDNIEKRYCESLLSVPFEHLKFERIRLRVFLEQGKKCNKCGLSTWLDHTIPYELNHIDGNNNNNLRINLEALCPNCHALTDTWRGRNKKNIGGTLKKVSDEILLHSLLKHDWNMRQALLFVRLSPKGGNYKRCHRLKKEFDFLDP